MSQILRILIVILVLSAVRGRITIDNEDSIAAPDRSTFRKDYRFYPAANGWIKLHIIPANWNAARLACHLEGSRLAAPINDGIYTTMRTILLSSTCKSVFVNVHTMATEEEYFSEEGVHISAMPVMWADGEPNNLNNEERCLAMTTKGYLADVKCESVHAFMCYKEKTGIMAMNECGNSDKQYSIDNRTGSCYKLHRVTATWQRAHSICTAEGGHLAIINSEVEAKVLKELASHINHDAFVFIGFYNTAWYEFHLGRYVRWSTLHGQTLEEAGFARWMKGEPNNLLGKENCGSFLHRKNEPIALNDANCQVSMPFICEIEVTKTQ